MASNGKLKSRALFLTGMAMAVAAAAGTLRSDLLLTRGFGNALEASRPNLSFDSAATRTPVQGAAVGDEGYWLTRSEVESPAPFAKPLAVGDRITIAGRDGRERQLEVMDMKTVGGNAARVLRTGAMRLLLVTCRVTGEGAEGAGPPVRFIIEADRAMRAMPAPAKAL